MSQLTHELQHGANVHARDGPHVCSPYIKGVFFHVECDCILRSCAFPCADKFCTIGVNPRRIFHQKYLYLAIAGRDLALIEIVSLKALAKHEQHVLIPSPLKGLGYCLPGRLAPAVCQLRQGYRVVVPCDDGTDNGLAGFSRNIGDHRGKFDVHHLHGLLHVLYLYGGGFKQP